MEFEESIYNLIPKEAYVPPKPARHQSKHHPNSNPTASTFCLNTTSKPGISNMTGDNKAPRGHHTNQSNSASFGLGKGQVKPDPGTFRLKNTGTFKLPEGKTHSIFKHYQRRLWLTTISFVQWDFGKLILAEYINSWILFNQKGNSETVVVTSYSRFIISTTDILIQFLFYSNQIWKTRK